MRGLEYSMDTFTVQENWRERHEDLQKTIREFILNNQDYDFPTELIKMVLSKEDLGV